MAAAPHAKWLKANGRDLAPLTGTDHRALSAIAQCWQLYAVERQNHVIDAVAHLVLVMQPSTRHLAAALIPWAMDWSDEEPVWTLVCNAIAGQA